MSSDECGGFVYARPTHRGARGPGGWKMGGGGRAGVAGTEKIDFT